MAVLRFRLSAVALRWTIGGFLQLGHVRRPSFRAWPPTRVRVPSAARARVRKVELIGDVDKDGGTTRGDASAGGEQKKARQKLLHLDGGGKPRRVAKEFDGEIFGIIVGVLAGEIGSGTQGEVTEAETELGIRARKAAALTVVEAMVAAG